MKNAISTWIANKRKIFEGYESGQVNSSQKKLKKIDYKDLDEAVFTWFKNARSNNIPVTEIIIKDQRDVVTSETHLPTDSEIIARVTQTQPDAVEHDEENEEDGVDWEISPPRRDQVRQPNETLQSCCL